MKQDTIQRIVLTGGPCSGKSTLIRVLAESGHSVSEESGRAIIRNQMRIDGPGVPWIYPHLYAELMLARDMDAYIHPRSESDCIFYDRGIPDIIGYLTTIHKTIPSHLHWAAEQYRYHAKVFLLPPWREIYTQDKERRQPYHEAVRTCFCMEKVYRETGYELIKVPQMPVGERMQFVLSELAKTD